MYATYIGWGFILFSVGFSGAFLMGTFKKGTAITS